MPWEAALSSLSYFKLMFDRSEVYGPMKVWRYMAGFKNQFFPVPESALLGSYWAPGQGTFKSKTKKQNKKKKED